MPIYIDGRHGEPYRPSNGSEGDSFEAAYCNRCTRSTEHPDGYETCSLGILDRAHICEIGEEGYPEEWVWAEGYPLCTAYDPKPGCPPAPVSLGTSPAPEEATP